MAESYVIDDEAPNVQNSAFYSAPIMKKARVPSGVVKVDANGQEISERTASDNFMNSKEFMEAFGKDASLIKNMENKRKVNITNISSGKPLPENNS
jgi:hypothetical protein